MEQRYKQMKDELGWADFMVRSDRAIRRHWRGARNHARHGTMSVAGALMQTTARGLPLCRRRYALANMIFGPAQ